MSQEIVIEVNELEKQYGSDFILTNISFRVFNGEIFALFGSDSSGKTIIIEILVGLRKPSKGKAQILGFDIKNKKEMREIKKQIGTLPQDFRTHNTLTVKENILFWGRMFDEMVDIEDLLELFNLKRFENVRYKRLSNFIKRKVGLAIAFVNNPKVAFLDEPSAGLDQASKREIWEILIKLKEEGKTIFFTTNSSLESQAIADKVAILHEGIIKDFGSPNELIDRYVTGNRFIIRCPNNEVKDYAITILDEVPYTEDGIGDLVVSSDEITLFELLEKLERAEVKYSDIITKRPTLNDVFEVLTGVEFKTKKEGEIDFE